MRLTINMAGVYLLMSAGKAIRVNGDVVALSTQGGVSVVCALDVDDVVTDTNDTLTGIWQSGPTPVRVESDPSPMTAAVHVKDSSGVTHRYNPASHVTRCGQPCRDWPVLVGDDPTCDYCARTVRPTPGPLWG